MSEQKQHPHYESMKLYLEDAAKTDKPWLLWRYRTKTRRYWTSCAEDPYWIACNEYQRIPQPIRIGDREVPKPLSEAPEHTAAYFYVDTNELAFYHASIWGHTEVDNLRLKRGIVHLTAEAALAHAKALIAISGGTYE